MALPSTSRRKILTVGLSALFVFPLQGVKAGVSGDSSQPSDFTLKGTLFEKVGKDFNLDPALLYAVACVESSIASGKREIRPHPWVLRTKKGPFYADTKDDVVKELKRLISKGYRSIDVGMFQINLRWHGHRVKHPEHLLDPETNMRVAAGILNDCLQRFPKDAFKAVGQYHSSDEKKALNYARFVFNVYTALKTR